MRDVAFSELLEVEVVPAAAAAAALQHLDSAGGNQLRDCGPSDFALAAANILGDALKARVALAGASVVALGQGSEDRLRR